MLENDVFLNYPINARLLNILDRHNHHLHCTKSA